MRPHTVLLHPTLRVIVYGLVWQWQREGGEWAVGDGWTCVRVRARMHVYLLEREHCVITAWSHGLHRSWLCKK